MAITIQNLRIAPYVQKNELKCVWGDTLTLTFTIPHVAGESYVCGIDNDRVVYPPSRPVCAYTNVFTRDGDDITFNLSLNTSKFRTYVSSIRKPMPVWLQVCRVGIDGKCETLVLDDILAIPSVLDATNTVCEGDPLKQLLDGKMDKPAASGAEGQVLTMDADGHYAWADLPKMDQEQADWDQSDSTAYSYIKNKPELAAVATSGSYDDLVDKPHIPVDPVQADYGESDSAALDYIRNKPDLSVYSLITETGNSITMSIDDDYDLVVSLLDKAGNTLSTQDIDLPIESMIVDATYAAGVLTLTLQNGNTVDVDISDIVSGLVPDSRTVNGHALSADVTVTAADMGLATVATTGSYNDLTDRPVIPEQVQSDWDQSDSRAVDFIKNKPEISGGAQADWDESDSASPAYIANKPDLGIYVEKEEGKGLSTNDFTNEDKTKLDSIAAGAEVNVQADWDESDSTLSTYIKNKPTIPAGQIQSNWDESDSASPAYILNKEEVDGTVDGVDAFADGLNAYFYGLHKPLTMAIADNSYSNGIRFYRTNTSYEWDLQWSADGGRTWTSFTWTDNTTDTVTIGSGGVADSIMLRGNNPGLSGHGYCYLNTTSRNDANTVVNASGHFNSVLRREKYWMIDDLSTITDSSQGYVAYGFFSDNNSAQQYWSCNLGDCSGLILGARKLTQNAYGYMFTKSPMTKGPQMLATDFAYRSCYGMISGGTNLSEIYVDFTTWPGNESLNNWLSGAAAAGVFKCPATLDTSVARSSSTIPANWTIETH